MGGKVTELTLDELIEISGGTLELDRKKEIAARMVIARKDYISMEEFLKTIGKQYSTEEVDFVRTYWGYC